MLLFLNMLETQQEKDLFSKVYSGYKYLMWYVANDILKDPHMAEDSVQEAFLAVTRHMDKLSRMSDVERKRFLVTIVKNKAIDLLRKQTPEQSMEWIEEMESGAEDLLASYIHKDNYARILEGIKKLDQKYRIVFEYKYLHQLNDHEIGDLLDISAKLVNVRIFRARKKLQEILSGEVNAL